MCPKGYTQTGFSTCDGMRNMEKGERKERRKEKE
jgi:hypothetical protein